MAGLSSVLSDVRPLRVSAAYRRLWLGQTVSAFGTQMTIVAIAYEVYTLTGSSFSVGLIGLAGLLPLVLGGLYGGALADAFDRRRVALASALGLWLCSMALVAHAAAGLDAVLLLYAVVAVQSAMFAVNSPARSAMLPRLLPADLLPAANALGMGATNLSFTAGPLLGGLLIAWQGVEVVYVVDVVLFVAALYSLVRLPAMPPSTTADAPVGGRRAPGLRSVVEGLRFLRTAPNVRMTFVLDIFAMALAQPRALFPALALTVFATGPETLGLLQAAPGIGAVVAFLVSGWISRVHRHGLAVVVAVCVYGGVVALAGVSAFSGAGLLWLCVLMLALSGAADMVSAAYRSTILQTAAPDELRGRMQGIFIVVVAGGPRVGDFLMGSLAALLGEAGAMATGGALCVAAVLLVALRQRRFLAYDARTPTP